MKRPFAVLLLLISCLAAQTPRGSVPRADATAYPAHAGQDGLQLGASVVAHKDLKKIFVTDVNQCCIVVEVAFYPPKNNFVKISLDDFMLREAGKDLGARVSTPEALAPLLAFRPPPPDSEHRVGVNSSSEVGYERTSGRSTQDPTQTTNRSGIYQRQSVGVGIPVGGKPKSPEAADMDNRQAIEAELKEKMLPETSAWEPVSGYLYFSVPKKSKGGYELVYMVGDKQIVLPLK